MATLLEQIHEAQPAFEKAIKERLLWKRRHKTANFSRSPEGREREEALNREGREIWRRTQPVIDAQKALMRAYLAANSKQTEGDNG